MTNAFFLKSARISVKKTVKVQDTGVMQFLRNASIYIREFTNFEGEEYTRQYVKGTDAISGEPVTNIELHADGWDHREDRVILTQTYTKVSRDKETKAITGTYAHAGGYRIIDKENFEALVAEATQTALGNGNDIDVSDLV